ncbi:uncharacterized protein JN550_004297 [Neoarthrinium moseri]|uniref:uncharacterized protein n=1 Tax=Neoarthrinium moseri TaxID=1658444 RepID=UPI001FDDF1FA|nr:uncharacterized protein JN550_004297 [Neoarthrinium moseri]KAI1872094.1 hypothetical protein JN550_004297 [Neoarthrinium moseri]
MAQLTWLITGCSSGFGEHFVHKIIARGDKIIATARNRRKIEHLKDTGADALQLDITDTQGNIDAVIAKAVSLYGRIDVLVNNAAYIAAGTIEDLDCEQFLEQFNTNLFGTIKVTKSVLPYFREQHHGMLVFIGSLSGWIGHPGVGAYASSKFALEGLAEAVHKETCDLGIRTLLVEPGRFRTNLLSQENLKSIASAIPDYLELSEGLLTRLKEQNQTQPGDPRKLVDIIIDMVREEGVANGREVPFRLPLGLDVYDDMKDKCTSTLKLLQDWQDVIRSTDYA